MNESQIEDSLIRSLRDLKYTQREDIRYRASLERNVREKFETLNRVRRTDGEFQRLLDEIITPDVYTAARTLHALRGLPVSVFKQSSSIQIEGVQTIWVAIRQAEMRS